MTTSTPAATGLASPSARAASASPGVDEQPTARGYHALVPVGELGVLLFGGFAPIPGVGETHTDTWLLDAGFSWTELSLDPSYSVTDHGAFDDGANRVVTGVGETWVLDPDSSGWERVEGPGPGFDRGSRTAYDGQSDRVILVTSGIDTGLPTQTWAYDQGTMSWTLMEPSNSPSPRGWGAMAYDTQSDRVILFGGSPAVGSQQLADTWAYDHDSDQWTERKPASAPSGRSYSAMAHEPSGDRMILFGGASGAQDREDVFDDTWAYDYDPNSWTELSLTIAPSARGWHAMALHEATGTIVLFGGGSDRNSYTAETWRFDPATDTWARWTDE